MLDILKQAPSEVLPWVLSTITACLPVFILVGFKVSKAFSSLKLEALEEKVALLREENQRLKDDLKEVVKEQRDDLKRQVDQLSKMMKSGE